MICLIITNITDYDCITSEPQHAPPSLGPLTCVLMCCSGAVTRLAQLSHNMTMMDRKRQAARIHRGRPERLQGRGGQIRFEAFKCVQRWERICLTWTCSRGSRAQPRRPLRAGRRACLSRSPYLPPSLRDPSPLWPNGASR